MGSLGSASASDSSPLISVEALFRLRERFVEAEDVADFFSIRDTKEACLVASFDFLVLAESFEGFEATEVVLVEARAVFARMSARP